MCGLAIRLVPNLVLLKRNSNLAFAHRFIVEKVGKFEHLRWCKRASIKMTVHGSGKIQCTHQRPSTLVRDLLNQSNRGGCFWCRRRGGTAVRRLQL